MQRLPMKVSRVPTRGHDLPLPQYQTRSAAGFDLHAAFTKKEQSAPGAARGHRTIFVGARMKIHTGLCFAIPDGYQGEVRMRSGLAYNHGLMLTNGVGTIDADYRGEVVLSIYNSGDTPFMVTHGMRMAQMVIIAYQQFELIEVDALGETVRGSGGFGSTGLAIDPLTGRTYDRATGFTGNAAETLEADRQAEIDQIAEAQDLATDRLRKRIEEAAILKEVDEMEAARERLNATMEEVKKDLLADD